MSFPAAQGEILDEAHPKSSGEDRSWMGQQMEEVVAHQQWSRSRTPLSQKTPTLMILSFLSGVVLALGHHLYYASRAGTTVHDSISSIWSIHSQQWILRFGLAFAFLVNSFLIITVGLAYTQCIWSSVKHRGVSIGGLDALFSAIENPWAFRKLEAWTTSPLGMILALIAWTLPLTAVITPSTLSIAPGIITLSESLPVPSIAWGNTGYSSGAIYEYGANTTLMQRLISSTVTGMAVLPIPAPSPNSSYATEFYGPSIECDYVDPGLDKIFWISALEATEINYTAINQGLGPWESTPFTENNNGFTVLAPNTSQVFRAFVPYGSNDDPVTNGACHLNTSCNFSLIFSKDWNLTLYDRTCDINSSPAFKCYTAMDCWTRNTSFKAKISFTNGLQQIDLSSSLVPFEEPDPYSGDISVASINTMSLFQALLPFLTGNVTQNYVPESDEMDIDLLWTGLPGSAELKGIMNPDAGQLSVARGRNLSAMLRELSHNASLSLLSNRMFTKDPPIMGNVTHLRTVNIYVYKPGILWLAYGVATMATLLAIGIGMIAQTSNDSNYGRGFSSFLYATRNSDLDDLVLEGWKSSMTWNDDASKAKLEKTKLRFRFINDERKERSTGGGHDAFVLDET